MLDSVYEPPLYPLRRSIRPQGLLFCLLSSDLRLVITISVTSGQNYLIRGITKTLKYADYVGLCSSSIPVRLISEHPSQQLL